MIYHTNEEGTAGAVREHSPDSSRIAPAKTSTALFPERSDLYPRNIHRMNDLFAQKNQTGAFMKAARWLVDFSDIRFTFWKAVVRMVIRTLCPFIDLSTRRDTKTKIFYKRRKI